MQEGYVPWLLLGAMTLLVLNVKAGSQEVKLSRILIYIRDKFT